MSLSQKQTQLCVLEPWNHMKASQSLPPLFLEQMYCSIPPMSFATFIYMNHLSGKLHTTSDANVISIATILQMRLDTAQDASRLNCWPVGAHFAREEEVEILELFHAYMNYTPMLKNPERHKANQTDNRYISPDLMRTPSSFSFLKMAAVCTQSE